SPRLSLPRAGTRRARVAAALGVSPLTAVSPQDVAALEYRAPHLAAASLAFAFPAPHAEARLLDVACGTGLVARELHRRGFRCLHGVDGSARRLAHPLPIPCLLAPCPAHLCRPVYPLSMPYLCLSPALPVPCPLTPGRLSVPLCIPTRSEGCRPQKGHPESVLPVSCPAGGFLCLTTRSNPSNLRYKAELEAALGQLERSGAWQKLLAQEVEYWERAVTEEESTQGNGYISGVVYIYQKCPVPHLEEG
uniref:Methyltransferase like 27 n=1 Tax=Ficedula albicollis TaxID=59894 RepID=A0A803VBU2_FICAL